jgi:hypothetical protein
MASSDVYKHGNEPVGSILYEKLRDWLKSCYVLKKTPIHGIINVQACMEIDTAAAIPLHSLMI